MTVTVIAFFRVERLCEQKEFKQNLIELAQEKVAAFLEIECFDEFKIIDDKCVFNGRIRN